MPHKCIATANKLLAEHNTQIEPIIAFGSDMKSFDAIGIRTSKIGSQEGEKGGQARDAPR